jgi:hypothetical protein
MLKWTLLSVPYAERPAAALVDQAIAGRDRVGRQGPTVTVPVMSTAPPTVMLPVAATVVAIHGGGRERRWSCPAM